MPWNRKCIGEIPCLCEFIWIGVPIEWERFENGQWKFSIGNSMQCGWSDRIAQAGFFSISRVEQQSVERLNRRVQRALAHKTTQIITVKMILFSKEIKRKENRMHPKKGLTFFFHSKNNEKKKKEQEIHSANSGWLTDMKERNDVSCWLWLIDIENAKLTNLILTDNPFQMVWQRCNGLFGTVHWMAENLSFRKCIVWCWNGSRENGVATGNRQQATGPNKIFHVKWSITKNLSATNSHNSEPVRWLLVFVY